MLLQVLFLSAVTAASGSGAPRWQLDLSVVALREGGQAGRAELVVDFERKMRYAGGPAGQEIDPATARLVEVSAPGAPQAAPLPFTLTPVTGQDPQGKPWLLRWPVPKGAAPGALLRYRLSFQAVPTPKVLRAQAAAAPAGPGDFATDVMGAPWDFGETRRPVMEGAWHCTVEEGTGQGGQLVARADGEYPCPIIGRLPGQVDAERYHIFRVRARRIGPTRPVSLLAGDWVPLATEAGSRELAEEFQVFSVDLRAQAKWQGTVDAPVLRWRRSGGQSLTSQDAIAIDWIRLEATPLAVRPGVLVRDPPLKPAAVEEYAAYYRHWTKTAQVYLANRTASPQTLAEVWAGNQVLSTAVEVRDGDVAVWHRLLPNPIPPGGVGCLSIHLARSPGAYLDVGVAFKRGAVRNVVLPCDEPPLRISDLCFSKDLRAIYAFVRSATDGGAITQVSLDGHDVTGRCDLGLASFHRGAALVHMRLERPLEAGSLHVLRVSAGSDEALAQVRAIPARFVLATYGREEWADYRAHGLNHYVSFTGMEAKSVAAAHAHGLTVGGAYVFGGGWKRQTRRVEAPDVGASRDLIRGILGTPGMAHWTHRDEPDVCDYHAGGPGRTARAVLMADGLYRWFGRPLPTLLQIDNTFRSDNYHTYAEIPDIAATHRYVLGQDDASADVPSRFVAEETDALRELKRSAEPRPVWWVTQFLRIQQDGAYQGRFPDKEEMRVQVLHALGAGAKGIVHYIHSGSSTGAEGARDRALWDSMTALHGQITAVAQDAASGSPVDWAAASPPSVEAHSLLCAGKTLLVVLLNTRIRSMPGSFEAQPVGPVDVTLSLPAALTPRAATLIGDNGVGRPLALERGANGWRIRVSQVTTAALLRIE